MASRLRLFGGQLKTLWEEQPVIFISIAMGISAPLLLYFSPLTKPQYEEMEKIPRTYPWHLVEDWKRKERVESS